MNEPRMPTSTECSEHSAVYETENAIGYAIWYPQMGGYVGKAVAVMDKGWQSFPNGSQQGGCIDVYVWHDGEFPFEEGSPRVIHHCDPRQFIEFGQKLAELNDALEHAPDQTGAVV